MTNPAECPQWLQRKHLWVIGTALAAGLLLGCSENSEDADGAGGTGGSRPGGTFQYVFGVIGDYGDTTDLTDDETDTLRVANLIKSWVTDRLDLAVNKGCDGVEPDNVDGYTNDPGFDFTASDQLDFNRWLATEAHARGLAVGLKNDLDQIPELVVDFDFSVNEQCHEYDECDLLRPFTDAGKPVFVAEYLDIYLDDAGERDAMCASSRNNGLRTLVLPIDLDDSVRFSCDGI